jgi:hypothetical protein
MPMKRNLKTGDTFQIEGRTGEFVVEETDFTGGGIAMSNDRYPDGHQVTARKLKDGKYDPHGKKLVFYQSGCFSNEILPDKITLTGEMTKTVTFTR